MILVTGGTGFVGRQVVSHLASLGCPLRLVVRPQTQRVIPTAQAVECPDIFTAGRAWWGPVLEGVDTVIHLAWYAEPGEYLQSPRNLSCLAGTLELAQACIAAGTRRFVGVGTCAEYDSTHGVPLTPQAPLDPQTLYAASKASAFHLLRNILPAGGVEFAWCRLFYLHGEGEDPRRLVPTIRRRMAEGAPVELTSGRQVRDFLDVAEAGRMIALAALGRSQGALNVCSGVAVTVRELAERIADEYGRRDLLRFGAKQDNLFDPPYVVGVPAATSSL